MMGEEMGDRLQQTLRSLCYKTQWKYAVFWKLKRRARMMLTWEDAYYNNHEPSSPSNTLTNLCSTDTPRSLHGSHYMGDPLGLAVAKMSYLVYSLGEGIIGQVAFTGKHRWIFADGPASISWSPTEQLDGWQTQFSAGIKTVAVVAVVPLGVVQLGSLNLVVEDLKLVNHIKGVFGLLQSSSMAFLPDSKLADMFPQVGNILNHSEVSNNCPHGFDQEASNKRPILQTRLLPSPSNFSAFCSNVPPPPVFHQLEIFRTPSEFVRPRSGNPSSDIQKNMQSKLFDNKNINLSGVQKLVDGCKVDHFCYTSDRDRSVPDRVLSHQSEAQQLPEPLGMQLRNESEGRSKFQGYENCVVTMDPPLKFSAGCELHEALVSSLNGQDVFVWNDTGLAEVEGLVEAPDGVLSSLCGWSDGSELLEAVVANAYPGTDNSIHETSLCKSANSLLTTESVMHTVKQIKHESSATDQVQSFTLLAKNDVYQHTRSTGGSKELLVRSPNETSSKTQGTCSDVSDMYVGPGKMSRKRARPGENCRPRPRDRQLIQDRIKELRDIVPNGSKCSIDALLERTIKHMLFLQSVTSHADKLKKCTESKVCDKISHLLGTCNHEHSASWALEVGIHSSACPIIVENLNINGQMLVEMLCEECSLFFKIAEVIRSLGFTILKGVTESRAEKTWACFVVEGQGNGSLQRMDILWSLMRLLHPETEI